MLRVPGHRAIAPWGRIAGVQDHRAGFGGLPGRARLGMRTPFRDQTLKLLRVTRGDKIPMARLDPGTSQGAADAAGADWEGTAPRTAASPSTGVAVSS